MDIVLRAALAYFFILFMQFQVNPTNVALGRKQTVWLNDGKDRLLTFSRDINIFP